MLIDQRETEGKKSGKIWKDFWRLTSSPGG